MTTQPLAARDIDDSQIIARLRLIGHGNAARGFRQLCASAEVCSNCGLRYHSPGFDCACTQPERTGK